MQIATTTSSLECISFVNLRSAALVRATSNLYSARV